MSVMAQYWPTRVSTVLAGARPIQGQCFDCNGPVLALYSLYSISPVPIQYRADIYRADTKKEKSGNYKNNLIYNYETLLSNVKLNAL